MEIPGILKKLLGRVRRIFLRERNSRKELLNKMPRNAICGEIGVWKGMFSTEILRHCSPKMLHLIDPWKFQSDFPGRMYGGTVAKEQADMDLIFDNVSGKLGGLPNVSIHRGFSSDVLNQFSDDYFDWLYIDGNHYYDYVKEDLEIALMKVKLGGYITGDDYTWGAKDNYPVKRAVNDFIKEKGLLDNLEVIESQFIITKQ